jgi:hypothetical protein
MSNSTTTGDRSGTKALWYTAYLLQNGNRYRVAIVDPQASNEWKVVDEQSICAAASIDLVSLKAEVDRRCQTPLSRGQAQSLLSDLRGHVLREPFKYVSDRYATVRPRIFAWLIDALVFVPVELLRYFVFSHSPAIALRATFAAASILPVSYRILMHG